MIEKLPFGRTGHQSSRTILGAAAFGGATQTQTDAAMECALEYGVNHVDVAASYGEAELRLGSWIARHGKTFFLATKTGERTADRAREEILRSLDRLQVDQIDLIQLHCLVDPSEWETALGPGGALEAAIGAREEGLVRYIGVTGHGCTAPRMHLRSLDRFDFDSVLLPCNYVMLQNAQYRADFDALVHACQIRSVAVQTIKSIVHAPWGDVPQTRSVWYRPLEDETDLGLAVHWVLGRPTVFLNTAGDVHLMPKVLEAASRYQSPPSDDEMKALVARLEMKSLFE